MFDEKELDARDRRLAEALRNAEEQARIAEDEARWARDNAVFIRRAIEQGQYWKLSGCISEADIESLSELSPMAQDIFEL